MSGVILGMLIYGVWLRDLARSSINIVSRLLIRSCSCWKTSAGSGVVYWFSITTDGPLSIVRWFSTMTAGPLVVILPLSFSLRGGGIFGRGRENRKCIYI